MEQGLEYTSGTVRRHRAKSHCDWDMASPRADAVIVAFLDKLSSLRCPFGNGAYAIFSSQRVRRGRAGLKLCGCRLQAYGGPAAA